MSKDEKRDKVRSILAEIAGNEEKGDKSKLTDRSEPTTSQTINSGSGNIQVAGNNNTVRK
jgi:hypothetical protein